MVNIFDIPEELLRTTGEKPGKVVLSDPIKETIGQTFARLLSMYRTQLASWAQTLQTLVVEEKDAAPAENKLFAFKPLSQKKQNELVTKRARDIRQRLIWIAERNFAAPGQKLEIKDNFPPQFNVDREQGDEFDPAAFWAYLENTYGGQKGIDAANTQTAEKLIEAFWLKRSQKMEVKGGYVTLSRSVSLDSLDKKYGKIKLCYHSQESIRKCCLFLGQFCVWADLPGEAHDLNHLAGVFDNYDYRLESRKQYKCGLGNVVIVTFQSSFEFRLSKELASRLQLFIGTYAPHALKD